MSRYVDIEKIEPIAVESSEVELGFLAYDYDYINNEPYLDIVLCKECILFADRRGDSWWDSDSDGYCRRISRFGDCKEVYVDDFCSYGEREEEQT